MSKVGALGTSTGDRIWVSASDCDTRGRDLITATVLIGYEQLQYAGCVVQQPWRWGAVFFGYNSALLNSLLHTFRKQQFLSKRREPITHQRSVCVGGRVRAFGNVSVSVAEQSGGAVCARSNS